MHDLAYANSFARQKRRETWFIRTCGRWYELDGFVVRKEERHRMVRLLLLGSPAAMCAQV